MILRALLTALALSWLTLSLADAQQVYGPVSNCSGTAGASAAQVVFPSSGTGFPSPQTYLLLQNTHATQDIWINILASGTATTASPSLHIFPGTTYIWNSPVEPIPPAISIIGSGAGTTYTCWYR
jgi:hypothetical protein